MWGLNSWHADCWEFARLQRAPVIAAARRRTGAVNDLSAYVLALRRDPDLPRLSLDGLAPVGSAILDLPEPCRVAADNDCGPSVRFDSVAGDELLVAARALVDVASGVMNAAASDGTVGTDGRLACGPILGLRSEPDKGVGRAIQHSRARVVACRGGSHIASAHPTDSSHGINDADHGPGGVWANALAAGALTVDQVAATYRQHPGRPERGRPEQVANTRSRFPPRAPAPILALTRATVFWIVSPIVRRCSAATPCSTSETISQR